VGSTTQAPLEFMLYPMALKMSGLWCFGLLIFGRISLGMMVGCVMFALSFWSPCVASMDCNVWSSRVLVVSMRVCALKSFTGLFPRSMLRIGHLPPLCVWRRSCSSLNVLLCLEVLSFALYLHPPRRCVLVSGCLHFLQNIGLVIFFLLQRYTCFPQATSYESHWNLYGDCECDSMLKSVPVSLTAFSSAPKIPLVVVDFVSLIDVLCRYLYWLVLGCYPVC